MKKRFCSVFYRGNNKKMFNKCINPLCYNFFYSDRYKGLPRQLRSDSCREIKRVITYMLMHGDISTKKIDLTDPQTRVLFSQFRERYLT